MNKLEIKEEILINGTPEKIWDVLVNPNKTKLYMFGCEAISDWKVGSELLWKGNLNGKEVIFVKGTVLSYDPPKRLSYSVFAPNSSIRDIPQNYLVVICTISSEEGKSLLEITQGDFAKVEDGAKRFNESNWKPVLTGIKDLVESETKDLV